MEEPLLKVVEAERVKLKKVLKKWEKSFLIKNGRTPNKEDLLGAPWEIQDVYREYNTLKTSLATSTGGSCAARVMEEAGAEDRRPELEKPLDDENGVFGVNLNKKTRGETLKITNGRPKTWKVPPPSSSIRDRGKLRAWRLPPRSLDTHSPQVSRPSEMQDLAPNMSATSHVNTEGEDKPLCVPSASTVASEHPGADDKNVSEDVLVLARHLGGQRKLKYRGVSLSMLENYRLDSNAPGDDRVGGEKKIRRCAGDSVLSGDSFLARILDQSHDCLVPGRTRDPASPGRTRDPASPGRTTDPALPGRTRDPASPGRTRDPASPGRTRDPASPGRTRDPASPGRTRDPASPVRNETSELSQLKSEAFATEALGSPCQDVPHRASQTSSFTSCSLSLSSPSAVSNKTCVKEACRTDLSGAVVVPCASDSRRKEAVFVSTGSPRPLVVASEGCSNHNDPTSLPQCAEGRAVDAEADKGQFTEVSGEGRGNEGEPSGEGFGHQQILETRGDNPNTLEHCSYSPGSGGVSSASESEESKGKVSKSLGGVASGGRAYKTSRGEVSDNFRRLNMKVKRYTRRPGRGFTGERYKRQVWKKRQKEQEGVSSGQGRSKNGGKFVCFKCGKAGHWARNCTDKGGFASLGSFDGEEVNYTNLNEEESMDLAALEALEMASPYPTIGEAMRMAAGEKVERRMTGEEGVCEVGMAGSSVASCPAWMDDDPNLLPHLVDRPSVEPLLHWEGGDNDPPPPCVVEALQFLGFSSFRPGQKEVVLRILSGRSTLMITPTGSGKSLCYQLPTLLYRQKGRDTCFTLVVSPLVSLMDDQVLRLPPGLKGACIHTNKTQLQRDKVFKDLAQGKVDILYLSPEALVGGALWSRRSGSGFSLKDLPPIAFACIDEVHCISEWSHNFRPSYLRLHKCLRDSLGVSCVLGLTATATHTTGMGVARQLGVADNDIIWGAAMPSNLHISVSRDADRDLALLELLNREPYRSLDSIIIYCTRQQTTEGVAQRLRTSLQSTSPTSSSSSNLHPGGSLSMDDQEAGPPENGEGKKRKAAQCGGKGRKKRKVGRKEVAVAECYHAGMSGSQRKSVQNKFMRGDLRIVVATVAFGMGLDKADVRAVIHYNMPQSMEGYVQEVGRAGRDGKPAYCHAFIDEEGKDLNELKRNIYSNSLDLYCLKKLVKKIFPDSLQGLRCEVAMDVEEMVENLDVSRETIETLLCYLELSGKAWFKGMLKDRFTVQCYGGSHQLKELSWKVPAIAAASAVLRQKGEDLGSVRRVSFSLTEVARCMGQELSLVRSELLGLQVNDRGTSSSSSSGGRSSVLVELSGLAFHLVAPGNLTCQDREEVMDFLHRKVREHEDLALEKLRLLHSVLAHTSKKTQDECLLHNSAGSLTDDMERYFSSNSLTTSDLAQRGVLVLAGTGSISPEEAELVGRDARLLTSRFSEHEFSGRSLARIFQGISSPAFPAMVWGRQSNFWRKYLHLDFPALCQVATKYLVS